MTTINISAEDQEQAAQWASNAFNNIAVCQPNAEDCIKLQGSVESGYILDVAKLVQTLQDEEDDDGEGQICSLYGHRVYAATLHLIDCHPDQLKTTENEPAE